MNNLTISIEDYLNPDEIKAIATEAVRDSILATFRGNEARVGTLISNLSYEIIFKAVSDAIGQDAQAIITKKVQELLEDGGAIRYEMWRKKDAWDRSESPALTILYDAIKQNASLIEEKVKESVCEYEFREIQTAMYEALERVLFDKIFGERKDGAKSE